MSSLASPPRARRSRSGALALAIAVLAVPAVLTPLPSLAQDGGDLDQTIDESQPIVTGERVLDVGHVDMGPRFIEGVWTFLIHDDVGKADADAQSVWRYPDETVLHVLDAGRLVAPDDPAYAFLGAEPGAPVWVSPQTQDPDVVWLGWNTQDPDVMASIDRGITLTLHDVEGPGTMTVFLQSGSFGEPQVLWDSRVEDPQSLWVDVNTHTHANWAFTEPGVYLVELESSADLVDGSSVSDTRVMRIAVGSATDPADALAASPRETDDGGENAEPADPPQDGVETDGSQQSDDPLVAWLVGAIVVVAAALAAAFILVAVRGARARRAALAGRRAENTDSGASE